jgi:hypothetical protein
MVDAEFWMQKRGWHRVMHGVNCLLTSSLLIAVLMMYRNLCVQNTGKSTVVHRSHQRPLSGAEPWSKSWKDVVAFGTRLLYVTTPV